MTIQKPAASQKSSFQISGVMGQTGLFLLNIFLPAIAAGGLLYVLAPVVNLWKLDRTVAIIIFAFVFVLLSAVLAYLGSGLRKKKYDLSRVLIIAIGGLVMPILILIGANTQALFPGESLMSRMIRMANAQPVDVSMTQLGSTLIGSQNPTTKVAGIKAIASIHSAAGLEQLLLVLNTDKSALANWQVAEALSTAIASYGVDAKPQLIATFQQHASTSSAKPGSQPTNLYERYFAAAMDGLQAEIKAQALSDTAKQSQLQQLSALSDQIKSNLGDLQVQSQQMDGGDPVLNFVLGAFLRMNLAADSDIYSFARANAADINLPDSVRGNALLLWAKLGEKDDMPQMYAYLTGSSEVLKASAFDAIASLNQKLSGAAKTK